MRIITKNKYANLNYDIVDKFDAGIVLAWHEVKSAKTWNVNIKDAIVKIIDNEIFITNMDIPLYSKTNINLVPGYQPKWMRKLLLKRKEIIKLGERTTKTGLTIIPLKFYEDIKKRLKMEIWLGKLRKKVEKKQIIKERDIQRESQKEIKNLKIWY